MSDSKEDFVMGGVDDGLDEPDDAPQDRTGEVGSQPDSQSSSRSSRARDEPAGDPRTDYADIPHRVRFDSPKDGRTEKTFALEDVDRRRLRDLESRADDEYEEKVYAMDVYVAALRSGIYNEDAFLTEMERIGYGHFD